MLCRRRDTFFIVEYNGAKMRHLQAYEQEIRVGIVESVTRCVH